MWHGLAFRLFADADDSILGNLRAWLRQVQLPQLSFLAYGFLPILCVSLALQDIAPLHLTARLVLVPATATAFALAIFRRRWGALAFVGLLSGMIAVACYDVVRCAFVFAGAMRDPIPTIGRMALDDPSASWVWGYVWRFIWNGGSMGVAFAMLPLRGVRSGLLFGLFVCGGLFATLAISPIAQQRFLALSAGNIAIALAGHLVYGGVLGWTLDRLAPTAS